MVVTFALADVLPMVLLVVVAVLGVVVVVLLMVVFSVMLHRNSSEEAHCWRAHLGTFSQASHKGTGKCIPHVCHGHCVACCILLRAWCMRAPHTRSSAKRANGLGMPTNGA